MLFERRYTAGLLTMGAVALVLNACSSSSASDTAPTTTGTGGTSAGVGGSSNGGTTSNGGTSAGGTAAGGAAAGASAGGSGPSAGGPTACTATTCQNPPIDPGTGNMPDGTGPNVQAIQKLHIGDSDRMGVASASAWQDFGFAISGHIYNDAKSGAATHCKPVDGAKPSDVIVNGTNGVDNSFGKNIIPIVLGLASNAPDSIQGAIDDGSFSVLVSIDKLGAGTDYKGLNAILYASRGTDDGMGGTVAPPANGDWSDYTWHPFFSQATGVPFATSYTVNNTWVSGSKSDIKLTLSFAGYDLQLIIHKGQVAFDFAKDHKSAANGNIGGVLQTDELTGAIKSIAGKVSSSLCSGSAVDGIIQQIKQASDIGVDGSQDPTKTCDGISIGLGFETTLSKIGPTAPETPTPPDPCADAGM